MTLYVYATHITLIDHFLSETHQKSMKWWCITVVTNHDVLWSTAR